MLKKNVAFQNVAKWHRSKLWEIIGKFKENSSELQYGHDGILHKPTRLLLFENNSRFSFITPLRIGMILSHHAADER